MSQVKKSDVVWTGAAVTAASLVGYEVRLIRQEDFESTLSVFARKVCWTHTWPGRVLFVAAWYGFAGWFGYHIAIEELRKAWRQQKRR